MLRNDENPEQTAVVGCRELGVDAETPWQAADKLRGSVGAAEYKNVILGLIFLKYISDAFETRRQKLANELKADDMNGEHAERLLESRDEYTAENIVPPETRWSNIQNQARQRHIARRIDDAMYAIERDNPKLKEKLPRDYARPGIPTERMGGLIEMIGWIASARTMPARKTSWAASTNTSSESLRQRKANWGASSSCRVQLCG